MTDLAQLVSTLRASRGFTHKRDISAVMQRLGASAQLGFTRVPNGDDCAVLTEPGGTGHLLFAIEGLVQDFVEDSPWFAGYSGVMVNLSDVAAMGGRPIAVVDALWSNGEAGAREVLAGMRAACERYGVPLVGGHTNLQSPTDQLAVAVLGRATRLITSFDAQPGDTLLMAVDLRGQWQDPYPFWNASTQAPSQRLRDDLAVLPALAEAGLCDAGKDISMAGVLGTLLMLLECSRVGAVVNLDRLPRPPGTVTDEQWLRWLCAFPSYGYVLSVRPAQVARVITQFAGRDITCAAIGTVARGTQLRLTRGEQDATLWDLAEQPFITGHTAVADEVAHA